MAYQERWLAGAITEKGDRACADRYALIRPVLEAYRRPFTVWDLGANLGYFGCRIAAEFGAVSVMVDQRPILVEACRENAIPTTIAMTHHLTADDLMELAQSEHADVVLALNVLHHMPEWRAALEAVLALGETILIETPGEGDTKSAHYDRSQALLEALQAERPELVGWSPSHVTPGVRRPMYLCRRPKSTLTASYAYRGRVRARGPHPVRRHTITSTATEKLIRFEDGEARDWLHGMNLWNWLQMGGGYPDRVTVQAATRAAWRTLSQPHGDFRPWNLILQGASVASIDQGHRRNGDVDGLRDTVAWIAAPELAYVAH
jgi:hypothetical protein